MARGPSDVYDSKCVLCDSHVVAKPPPDGWCHVNCPRCGEYLFDGMLAWPHGVNIARAELHLLGGYTREKWELSHECVRLDSTRTCEQILSQCPRTVREKAEKLLIAIQRKTEHFGQTIRLGPDDYRLGYAKNYEECRALARYLQTLELIDATRTHQAGDVEAVVTGAGFEAIESRLMSPAVSVFISSTCYDLLDLRAELADFLESKGFIVRASDDPDRIDVEPTVNSIETCLRNVEAADVVVCILDGRYGPLLPPDKEVSATQAEVQHARKHGRPVYIFGRDRALSDYDQLRKNENADTSWVEKSDLIKRKKWLAFAKELQGLASAQEQGFSNWIDPFRDSVQLKKLVLKRLSEFRQRRK